jgi:hypothetical protein
MGIPLQASIETLNYSETVHDRTGKAVNGDVPPVKICAIREIKRFSLSADKDVMNQYVGEHVNPTFPSGLDIPLAVHLLISRGIEFSRLIVRE